MFIYLSVYSLPFIHYFFYMFTFNTYLFVSLFGHFPIYLLFYSPVYLFNFIFYSISLFLCCILKNICILIWPFPLVFRKNYDNGVVEQYIYNNFADLFERYVFWCLFFRQSTASATNRGRSSLELSFEVSCFHLFAECLIFFCWIQFLQF